jgi:non-specific serine/threonine protein kinase
MQDAAERGDAERAEVLRDALEARVGGTDEAGERARINVTRAVKLAIRRIGEVESRLGRDLETNLKTGVFCCYAPDPHHPVRWRITP